VRATLAWQARSSLRSLGLRLDRARLRRAAEAVMAAEGCDAEAELSVAMGDDEWIRRLNRRYKGRDAATDVLAFPQGVSPAGTSRLLGDVAISVETAARQARERGHEVMAELALLVTHGILHLTQWSDETPRQRREMMARARDLLKRADPGLLA